MIPPQDIRIDDFDYLLPSERIAQFPREKRDSSKLIIWNNESISETVFSNIDQYLPGKSILVFNDTKVIRARLIFSKETGATIEVFCLEPVFPTAEIQQAFQQKKSCTWTCLVGNSKRWKSGTLQKEVPAKDGKCLLNAEKGDDLGDGHFQIHFTWEPVSLTFSEILEACGRVPLPPYITRGDDPSDASRYQTIYASEEGSVAAPTAGLHFTDEVMKRLHEKKIGFEKLVLHIGVGTFRPVITPSISGHIMHGEKIFVTVPAIKNLIQHLNEPLIAVGTTTVRTLETLYWLGVKLITENSNELPEIHQWDPYELKISESIPAVKALTVLVDSLEKHDLPAYSGSTQLMIVPGYRFRIVDVMITNFHMPRSTLLLLIAAFIGDEWRNVYDYALNHDFRMLSYGDSCLFFRKPVIFSSK